MKTPEFDDSMLKLPRFHKLAGEKPIEQLNVSQYVQEEVQNLLDSSKLVSLDQIIRQSSLTESEPQPRQQHDSYLMFTGSEINIGQFSE